MNIEPYEVDESVTAIVDSFIHPETGELIEMELMSDEDIKALEVERKEKQCNLILHYRNLGGKAEIIQREIDRLKRLKQIVENKQEAAKYLLASSMKGHKEKEVDFDFCKAKFKKNPPKLVIAEGTDLSKYEYEETIVKVDKKAIKKALKDGEYISGCFLDQEVRLDIK